MTARTLRFAWRRSVAAVLLVFVVSAAAQLLAQLAPGDYVSGFGGDPAQAAAERHRLGLDRPAAEQFETWLSHSVRLDLGESFRYRRPVAGLVIERGRNTAILAAAALLVATCLGIPAGVLTGSRRGGVLVALVRAASLLLVSVPPLITSLALLTVAARTGWLPVSGMGGISHLVIPTLALALPVAASLERIQSRSIAEALARPTTTAARARGVPPHRVLWGHAWRQSLGPILGLYGVIAGSLFSGSLAVEIVTSWPGLGNLMFDALMARDTHLIAGCAAAGAVFVAAGVLAADIVHASIDPRVVEAAS